jgi:hypothetical protein
MNVTLQETRSYRITERLWPEAAGMDEHRRMQAVESIVELLYLLPFALAGLVWLIVETDSARLFGQLDRLAILFLTMLALLLQPFDIRIRLDKAGNDLKISSSLAPLVMWATLFISGGQGLWAMVAASAVAAAWRGYQLNSYGENSLWEPLSGFIQQMATYIFTTIVAATLYLATGGVFPVTGVEASDWIPAFVAIIAGALLMGLIMLPPALQIEALDGQPINIGTLVRIYLGVVALPLIMSPFSILIAILSAENRVLSLIFSLIGVFLVNRLAHHMSRAITRSNQQAREFEELEALGEAIIQSDPDGSTLPEIVTNHLGGMFPVERVEVRIFEPEKRVVWSPFRVSQPAGFDGVDDEVWEKMKASNEYFVDIKDVVLPGDRFKFGDALAVKVTTERPGQTDGKEIVIGGVYLLRHRAVGNTIDSLPVLQSLASQLASAVYRAEVFAETMAFQKTRQELEFAGRIQTSFLPTGVPEAENWQLAAVLESARQTSGDFYDFIPFDDGLIGIVVADVSDKGTGAALYMAMSRTLIRTYAMQLSKEPELALAKANDRLMEDSVSDQFVTVFYGVLDTTTGELTYANAGHNPPYLLRRDTEESFDSLTHTGIPLGMFEEMTWERKVTRLDPGELLLVYSDGVPEAQTEDRTEFGDDQLVATARASIDRSAEDVREAIMNGIHDLVGDAPQFDDMTLVVISRDTDQAG